MREEKVWRELIMEGQGTREVAERNDRGGYERKMKKFT